MGKANKTSFWQILYRSGKEKATTCMFTHKRLLRFLAFLSLTLVSCATLFAATAPEVEWERTFGGNDADAAYCAQQTSDGGYIVVGRTLSFGAGSWDVYLIKTDPYGNKLWERTFGGAGGDEGRWVQQTSDGGYIIVGDTTSFGEGRDVYLVKTDVQGNRVWERVFGRAAPDWGYCVQQTSDGGYIVVGDISNPPWDRDVYLVKIDVDGNIVWERTLGGDSDQRGYSVQQTSDGGYIVAGRSTTSDNGDDACLIKTSAEGDMMWETTFGGDEFDTGRSVQQTSDGGYILVGYTASFGSGQLDVFLVKVDEAGDKLWEKTFGGAGDDVGYCVRQTLDGGYVIAGGFEITDGAPGDVYVIKTDAVGNMIWEGTFGDPDHQKGYCIQQTSDGGYIVAGYTCSYGPADIYIIKLKPPGNQPPVASFNFSPAEPTVSKEVTFVASAYDPDGQIVSYEWDFGDGNTGQGPVVTHAYSQAGTYTVKLTVTDDLGAQGFASKDVVVGEGQDTAPPALIQDFQARDGEDRRSTLTWTNPPDADLAAVVVRRKTDRYPADHTDGDLIYQDTSPTPGQAVSYTDTGLANGTTYYYAVFSRDAAGNWNVTVQAEKNADTAIPGVTHIKAADLFVVPGSVIVNHQDLESSTKVIKIGAPLTKANQICIIATVGNAGPDDVYANVEIYNDKNEKLANSVDFALKKGAYKILSVTIDLQKSLDEWTSFKVQIHSDAQEVEWSDNVAYTHPIQYRYLREFDVQKDTYAFSNPKTPEIAGQVVSAFMDALQQRGCSLPKHIADAALAFAGAVTGFGGVCFGMSSTVGCYSLDPSLKPYPEKDVSEYPFTDPRVAKEIVKAQAFALFEALYFYANVFGRPGIALSPELPLEPPYVLCMSSGEGSHAVFPYASLIEKNKGWKYFVYDPNTPPQIWNGNTRSFSTGTGLCTELLQRMRRSYKGINVEVAEKDLGRCAYAGAVTKLWPAACTMKLADLVERICEFLTSRF